MRRGFDHFLFINDISHKKIDSFGICFSDKQRNIIFALDATLDFTRQTDYLNRGLSFSPSVKHSADNTRCEAINCLFFVEFASLLREAG